VETKWCHDVTRSWRRYSAPERGDFSIALSLLKLFNLFQYGSPLFGFLWFIPGFVKLASLVRIDTHDLTSLPDKNASMFGLPDSFAPSKMNFTFARIGAPLKYLEFDYFSYNVGQRFNLHVKLEASVHR